MSLNVLCSYHWEISHLPSYIISLNAKNETRFQVVVWLQN